MRGLLPSRKVRVGRASSEHSTVSRGLTFFRYSPNLVEGQFCVLELEGFSEVVRSKEKVREGTGPYYYWDFPLVPGSDSSSMMSLGITVAGVEPSGDA